MIPVFNLAKAAQHGLILPKKGADQYDPDELAAGIKVEAEHTADPEVAAIIAANHLDEMPDYYTRLAKMEGAAKGGSMSAEFGVGKIAENKRAGDLKVGDEVVEKDGGLLTITDIRREGNNVIITLKSMMMPKIGPVTLPASQLVRSTVKTATGTMSEADAGASLSSMRIGRKGQTITGAECAEAFAEVSQITRGMWVINDVTLKGSRVYWTGKDWSSHWPDAKGYRSQEEANADHARLKLRGTSMAGSSGIHFLGELSSNGN